MEPSQGLQRAAGHDHLATAGAHAEHAAPHGWRRWVFATNHKDIGTMYLVLSCTMWLVGGTLAMLIRLELFKPGLQFLDPTLFNSLTTTHGLVMILDRKSTRLNSSHNA